MQREYGQYAVPTEPGYDFSVLIDLDNLPADKGLRRRFYTKGEPNELTQVAARDDLVMKMALLKRNAMAAPFEQAYAEYQKLKELQAQYTSEEAPQGVREGGAVKTIQYREEEAIYVKASHDRVTVIFSTVFREETDRVFGKVFIQEFVDARRRAIQNAPQVLFRNDPPLELQGVPGINNTGAGEIGYVTFGGFPFRVIGARRLTFKVLFPRHLTPQRMNDVISHIQTFRDYFHYHIKASKAYIHSRMRKRTADFLQGKIFGTGQGRAVPRLIIVQSCGEPDQTTRRRRRRQRVEGRSRLRVLEVPRAVSIEAMPANHVALELRSFLGSHVTWLDVLRLTHSHRLTREGFLRTKSTKSLIQSLPKMNEVPVDQIFICPFT